MPIETNAAGVAEGGPQLDQVAIVSGPESLAPDNLTESYPEIDAEQFAAVGAHRGNMKELVQQFKDDPNRPMPQCLKNLGITSTEQLVQHVEQLADPAQRQPTIRELREAKSKEAGGRVAKTQVPESTETLQHIEAIKTAKPANDSVETVKEIVVPKTPAFDVIAQEQVARIAQEAAATANDLLKRIPDETAQPETLSAEQTRRRPQIETIAKEVVPSSSSFGSRGPASIEAPRLQIERPADDYASTSNLARTEVVELTTEAFEPPANALAEALVQDVEAPLVPAEAASEVSEAAVGDTEPAIAHAELFDLNLALPENQTAELVAEPADIYDDFTASLSDFLQAFDLVPEYDEAELPAGAAPVAEHELQMSCPPIVATVLERLGEADGAEKADMASIMQQIAETAAALRLIEADPSDVELSLQTEEQLLSLCERLHDRLGIEFDETTLRQFVEVMRSPLFTLAPAAEAAVDLENDGTHEAKHFKNLLSGRLAAASRIQVHALGTLVLAYVHAPLALG